MCENNPEFYRKIIFIDEGHFHLEGYGNKPNLELGELKNEKHHSQPFTVWCCFWADKMI